MQKGLRTWIEVDTKALRRNYTFFRRSLGKERRLMAIVKSNAYGHGLVDFSRAVSRLGADWLGVDSVIEALALRRAGIRTPLLVLGATLPENCHKAARASIRVTVSTLSGLRAAAASGARFHLKVDTGMHRQGFLLAEMPMALAEMRALRVGTRQFEGLYTHLASPAMARFRRETRAQIAEFRRAAALVGKAGYRPLRHAAATGGALCNPAALFDMARIGIGLYGLLPGELAARPGRFSVLHPILSWKTRITEVKELPRGVRVGYDFTTRLARPSRLAVLPVGYWHGYPRLLSNRGEVLVEGVRASVVGRVSMDMLVIDVTDIPRAGEGSEAVLIGRSGRAEISAPELAAGARTSAYEILTRLNPLMKKVYL